VGFVPLLCREASLTKKLKGNNFNGEVDANNNLIEPFYNIQGDILNPTYACPDTPAVKFNFVEKPFVAPFGEKVGTKDNSGSRYFDYVYPALGTPGSTGADPYVCVGPEVLGKDLLGNPRFECSFGAVEAH